MALREVGAGRRVLVPDEALARFTALTMDDVEARALDLRDYGRAMTWWGLHTLMVRLRMKRVGELNPAVVQAWARHLVQPR